MWLEVVSYRNSTSNHNRSGVPDECPPVVSYRNSTSNHNGFQHVRIRVHVVSYRNSTSNHNNRSSHNIGQLVVSYRNSTSNHNINSRKVGVRLLYLIEILHQTTTLRKHPRFRESCILSKFYIKPQPSSDYCFWWYVVSYRNSTSNHNFSKSIMSVIELYLIEILHQTTTGSLQSIRLMCCILSKFYIKPQPLNVLCIPVQSCILSKFYIKPQRVAWRVLSRVSCILSKFYIKPQLLGQPYSSHCCCILSKFYIKPQRRASYWLIKCYLRAVCHYKNTIGCSDEASLMHFPYFKERK